MKYKNNPFNIRSGSRWLGLTGSRNGFCEFETLEYGVRAACVLLLQSYRKKGVRQICSIISRFAPPSENNTAAYMAYLSRRTGFPMSLVLRSIDEYLKILSCMSWYESRTRISESYIFDVIHKYDIKLFY